MPDVGCDDIAVASKGIAPAEAQVSIPILAHAEVLIEAADADELVAIEHDAGDHGDPVASDKIAAG